MTRESEEIKEIFVEGDKYESRSIFVRFLRFFVIPIINNTPPRLLQKIMHISSRDSSAVVKKTGSAHALEVMYAGHKKNIFANGIMEELFNYFWHHIISQPAALRNRLKIIKEQLEKSISALNKQDDIKILSVGSGSARAVLGVVKKFKENNKYSFEVVLFDKSKDALDLSKDLAKKYKVDNICSWQQGVVSDIDRLLQANSFDIIEIVGLVDYFNDDKAVDIFKKLHLLLRSGGIIFAANVRENKERRFVENTGWPKMYYRDRYVLAKILKEANFRNLLFFYEPMLVHIIITAQK